MVLVTIKREKESMGSKDRELNHRLFHFLKDQRICSVYPTNSLFVMDDKWEGFFTAEDAEKVKNWLLEQGAKFEGLQ